MAEMTKGDVIRNILKSKNGAISSDDVVTLANAAGVETTVAYVRLIRSEMTSSGEIARQRKRKVGKVKNRKHGQPQTAPEAKGGDNTVGGFSTADLLAVKKLSERFGGLDKVEKAVQTLRELSA